MEDRKRFKTDTRNLIDTTLLAICITLFGLVASIKSQFLANNSFFTMQLVVAVPFFICGLLSRIKEASYADSSRWEKLSLISFTIAYGFFVNSVGILLSFVAPISASILFFAVNTGLSIVRACIVVSYRPSELNKRIIRELVHISMIVFLGVLPALNLY